MNKYKKCEICGLTFHQQSGWFTNNLLKEHNISLKDYIIKYELNGEIPKCQCGYCNEDKPFFRGKFLDKIWEHKKYTWLNKQYILKNGKPKCITCGKDVKWKRNIPNKYCSYNCHPSNWNQEKIKRTVKEKYKVDVISQLDEVKKKLSEKQKDNQLLHKCEIIEKYKNTCMKRYGVDHTTKTNLFIEKYKNSCMENLGVTHPSKLLKNRNNASLRMIENNSKFNFKDCYKVKQYKETNLCYQSSYEYHFLEFCENNNILDKVKNGNIYNFLLEECDYGFRTITDFCIDNIEIEIKSTYILKKQGGKTVIDIKRCSVERTGKSYLLILNKNYNEFKELFL